MQVTVSGHHVHVTPALETHVAKRSKKLTNHIKSDGQLEVILTVENKHSQLAEAKIHMLGKTFFAKSDSEDMYHSIDLAMDKLQKQIEKYEDKHRDHAVGTG